MMENVFSYFFLLINTITCIIAFKLLTNSRMIIIRKNIFMVLIVPIISLLIRFMNNGFLMLITNILFIYCTNKIFFEQNSIKTLYFAIEISVISLFCDSIISIIINNFYLFNIKLYQQNFYLRAILIFPVCILILAICVIPFINNISNDFYDKYLSKTRFTKSKIFLFLLIISLIALFFALNAYNEVNRISHSIIIIGILAFTLLFILTLYLMYREYQIEQVNKKIIIENDYIKMLAKKDEEFKHNVINNLLGIKTVANKKTNSLIDELICSYQSEYKTITNINDLPNGIQSIVYRKAYQENIENLNLIVTNSIYSELYKVMIPKVYNNLCTAIGILFDNAIEAVEKLDEKIISIEFNEDDNNIYIIIKNSFSNLIDIDEIGNKKYTTKDSGHGIGINYVKKLKTLKYKAEIINNMFCSKLIIEKSKKI